MNGFSPDDDEINAEKIITVKYATHAVAKKRHTEKVQACQVSNLDLCDTCAAL